MEKEKSLKASLALILSSGNVVKIGDIKAGTIDDGHRVNLDDFRQRMSFSTQLSQKDVNKLMGGISPLLKAEKMAKQLRAAQRLWNEKIKYMDRGTRRAFTRRFWANYNLFTIFCTKHGIN